MGSLSAGFLGLWGKGYRIGLRGQEPSSWEEKGRMSLSQECHGHCEKVLQNGDLKVQGFTRPNHGQNCDVWVWKGLCLHRVQDGIRPSAKILFPNGVPGSGPR
jgi:hypothetical protein